MERISYEEVIVSLAINVIGGLLVLLLTTNAALTLITLAALLPVSYGVMLARRYYLIISNAKIRKVHSNQKDCEGLLQDYFRKARKIRILAIRAWHILGSDRGFLSKTIMELPRGWGGEIRVLLLHPESSYMLERADEIDLDGQLYKQQSVETARYIRFLKENRGINIQLKYYRTKPHWRFILLDDQGFVSYYLTKEEGSELPQYELYSGYRSLFDAFSKLFEQVWGTAEEVII